MKTTRRATVVAIVILGSVAPSVADGDELKALLDKPTCKRWKDVSNATLARLRKANESGGNVDLKQVELSFTLMDFCLGEITPPSHVIVSGLTGNENAMKRAARTLAALLAYYKEALGSMEPATSLKIWPELSSAANSMIPDLRGLIEQKFGERSFDRYMQIANTPEVKRSAADQKTYAEMHSWLEPL